MTQRNDGEIIGVDTDGCVIQWDARDGEPYNSGETVFEFGLNNMSADEIVRVGL